MDKPTTDYQLSPLRVVAALCGDIDHDPESIVKYGTLIEALGNTFPVTAVYNAKLQDLHRLKNLIMTWHPDPKKWSARADKNPYGFINRSRLAARWAINQEGQADFLFQLGVLFDAGWDNNRLPCVIYTDYTASMSAKRPAAGRSPFRGKFLSDWLELEAQAFKRAMHICVRSEVVKKSIMEDYALPSGHVTVVGGGVNLRNLPPVSSRPVDRPPTVLFIGTDFYRKGGDLVLSAFALARLSIPNAQLIFVSEGPIPLTFPRRGVKFLQPVWNRKSFLELYSLADVLILPSRLETWGDVLLEAMAFGLPCIGVTGQPMEEIIRNGKTGLLVPPERIDALADALIHLLTQPQLCRRMGEAGRNLVSDEYTWAHVVDRIAPVVELYVRQSSPVKVPPAIL